VVAEEVDMFSFSVSEKILDRSDSNAKKKKRTSAVELCILKGRVDKSARDAYGKPLLLLSCRGKDKNAVVSSHVSYGEYTSGSTICAKLKSCVISVKCDPTAMTGNVKMAYPRWRSPTTY
jgi:hypothetical protein